MRFNSDAHKIHHPQAKLIPDHLWSKIYSYEMSNYALELMSIPENEVLDRLRALDDSLTIQAKFTALLCCAYRKPPIKDVSLHKICSAMQISTADIVTLATKTGRHSLLFEAFRAAAGSGNLATMSELIRLAPKHIQQMINAEDFSAFRAAAEGGHIEIMRELIRLAPERAQEMIAVYNFESFRQAAIGGHIEVIRELISKSPQRVQEMIAEKNFLAFHWATLYGHVEIMRELIHHAPECLQDMITAKKFGAFREAAGSGQIEAIRELMRQAPEYMQEMIAAEEFRSFRAAAGNGHIEVMRELIHHIPERLQDMIASSQFGAFIEAAANGHIDVIKELMRLVAPERAKEMIATRDFGAFRLAASNDKFQVLKELIRIAPERGQDMVAASDFYAFRLVARTQNTSLINTFLNYPRVLAYAELHQDEHAHLVKPFIENKINILKNRHAAGHPSVVITKQEAISCFYILRNLMRQTPSSAATLDRIDFLINIPAVKSLLHCSIEHGIENELLREAMRNNNQVIVERLLAIPAVNELARHHDFYPNETRGYLDLKALADFAESSMMALSPLEEKMLERIKIKYKPVIDKKGVNQAFDEVYQAIINRYKTHPIKFKKSDDESISLPLTKQEFDSLVKNLKFSPEEITQANKCYYQHSIHTLYRYLTKGNPWMHPQASHVEIDPKTRERSADFSRYKELIVLLWTAAADPTEIGTNGFTQETRLDELITQIGRGIGRAHNWDKPKRHALHADGSPRLNACGAQILEQFDDLEGDRPSCSSGVRRRLFQSLLGHPLYMQDIRPVIQLIFRDKIREYCKALIQNTNTDDLEAMLVEHARIAQGEIPGDLYLALSHKFNIPQELIQTWSQEIHQKYDEIFENKEVTKCIDAVKTIFFTHTPTIGQFLASVDNCNLIPMCQEILQQRNDGFMQQLLKFTSSEDKLAFLKVKDSWTELPHWQHAIHLGLLGEVGRFLGSDTFLKFLTGNNILKAEIIDILAHYADNNSLLIKWLNSLPMTQLATFMNEISTSYQALQSTTASCVTNTHDILNPEEPSTAHITFENLPDYLTDQSFENFEPEEHARMQTEYNAHLNSQWIGR